MITLVRDEPGTILAGKYELLRKAGTGGMAVVWKARTLGAAGFSRPVAVKRIIPHLATSQEFVAMFVEESRVVSELQHPGIAQIHDFGADDAGHHFLVLEWIEGVDLQELVDAFVGAAQPTPWTVMAEIVVQVLGALGAAHERRDAGGVVSPVFHRDVTPHNVRVGALGYVKLTDFGIARAADRSTMTRPDAIKGKLSYVAPEMLKGAPASVRTDLFAVGIVLWEALAGRRLFEAPSDMQVMFMVHDARVPDLRTIRPDIPEALAATVHRALAKDAAGRFESAHEMARALVDVLRAAPEPVDARTIASLVEWARPEAPKSHAPGAGTTEIELEEIEDVE
ncbi:serine/threonine-protein kinase [Sandaracinus amylolyticus]|uniref:Serine/threonine protein kinase n=1 Tax=Sandaracinus amylolyticus TaxID=927083 RepID=A0A0F6YMC1_9BACT|nr:serine/threonine-protein kinase [Sandaracinus amylolyticus]AKF09113.1 serine/threonine protein kinase [Sandaracinus amylolyticus]